MREALEAAETACQRMQDAEREQSEGIRSQAVILARVALDDIRAALAQARGEVKS